MRVAATGPIETLEGVTALLKQGGWDCLLTLDTSSAPVNSAPTPKSTRRSPLTFARKFPRDLTAET